MASDAPAAPDLLAPRSIGDATLGVPSDWHVSSIVTAPAAPGQYAPNLVVSRDRMRPGEDLTTYASRQLVELTKHLKQFKLHGRKDVEVAGRKGHEVACGWSGERGPIEQRLTMVPRDDGSVLTCTATMPKARAGELAPLFAQIVASLRFIGA